MKPQRGGECKPDAVPAVIRHGAADRLASVLWNRAEPLLARIKADRTVVVSPVFDKIHFDDLHVEKYIPFSHGFDWELWCTYEPFSPDWLKANDESQPGK